MYFIQKIPPRLVKLHNFLAVTYSFNNLSISLYNFFIILYNIIKFNMD